MENAEEKKKVKFKTDLIKLIPSKFQVPVLRIRNPPNKFPDPDPIISLYRKLKKVKNMIKDRLVFVQSYLNVC